MSAAAVHYDRRSWPNDAVFFWADGEAAQWLPGGRRRPCMTVLRRRLPFAVADELPTAPAPARITAGRRRQAAADHRAARSFVSRRARHPIVPARLPPQTRPRREYLSRHTTLARPIARHYCTVRSLIQFRLGRIELPSRRCCHQCRLVSSQVGTRAVNVVDCATVSSTEALYPRSTRSEETY